MVSNTFRETPLYILTPQLAIISGIHSITDQDFTNVWFIIPIV